MVSNLRELRAIRENDPMATMTGAEWRTACAGVVVSALNRKLRAIRHCGNESERIVKRPGCINLTWSLIFTQVAIRTLAGTGRTEHEELETVQMNHYHTRDLRKSNDSDEE